jgi:hypothetical protein
MQRRSRLAGVPVMNYARRQQYRRLSHAARAAAVSGVALSLALVLASASALSLAAVSLIAAAGFAFAARHWLALAGRSRVGARSEDEVHRQLGALERDGWRMRHSLSWQGSGDIDSVAIAPSRIAFAVETRPGATTSATTLVCGTSRHGCGAADDGGAGGVRCRRGAVPVLCVVRARGLVRWEHGVLVVSPEWLVPTLQHAADVRAASLRGLKGAVRASA